MRAPVEATDNEADPLTYLLATEALPRGAIYNEASRQFSWTPDYEQSGSYEVAFVVTDGVNPPVRRWIWRSTS